MSLPGHNDSGQPMPRHDDDRGGSRSGWAPIGDGRIYPSLDNYPGRAHSFVDAWSYVNGYAEEPVFATRKENDQRERRLHLYEPMWMDRPPINIDAAFESAYRAQAAPVETRREPSAPTACSHGLFYCPYRGQMYPCQNPKRHVVEGEVRNFGEYVQGQAPTVQAVMDFSYDKVGFMVMDEDGKSAQWIGQPGDHVPPPLLDRPVPRRDTSNSSPEQTSSEAHSTTKMAGAGSPTAQILHKDNFDRQLLEVIGKFKHQKLTDSKKSASSKRSGSSKGSKISKGSTCSKRSRTLVAGSDTDIDKRSSLSISLHLKN
ncbi:uncharacterized protein IWZ02DRAFT_40373 [Phyllosticta citriasiana]